MEGFQHYIYNKYRWSHHRIWMLTSSTFLYRFMFFPAPTLLTHGTRLKLQSQHLVIEAFLSCTALNMPCPIQKSCPKEKNSFCKVMTIWFNHCGILGARATASCHLDILILMPVLCIKMQIAFIRSTQLYLTLKMRNLHVDRQVFLFVSLL